MSVRPAEGSSAWTKGLVSKLSPSSQVALFGILLIMSVGAAQYAQALLVPVVSAFLFSLLLGRSQERLERLGLNPTLSATVVFVVFLVAVAAAVRLSFLPFEEWSSRLPEIWAALKSKLFELRALLLKLEDVKDAVQQTTGLDTSSGGGGVNAPNFLTELATGVPATAGQLVIFGGVLFFLLASRSKLLTRLRESDPVRRPWTHRLYQFLKEAEAAVSTYLAMVSVINICLGLVVGLALFVMGFPNAWFWGFVAGLMNFVPYIGPLLVTLLLLGAGLLQDGSLFTMVSPALVFFVINMLEANFVTPAVLGRSLLIEPLFVVLSLAFWLWLWGPTGALLAVPLMLLMQSAIFCAQAAMAPIPSQLSEEGVDAV
ncbi:AI-2E family transporter [Roseibium sp. CAU 1637]|uniref:AI-2E family transporter n=1 Tax=Roseibium limicola TaxID=2816037 RepID=A0A939EQY8_9HYPH|nr:AI-2E family transporter [Roseibium limicola]MBO0347350.1 AI-2E family transporter [Roseibium limicola]